MPQDGRMIRDSSHHRSATCLSESLPQRETGRGEVLIEAQDMAARGRRHDGEADGIRVRDRPRRQPLEPATGRGVIVRSREVDGHARARVETFQRPERRLNTGPEERQPVGFRDDEIRGQERDATPEGLPNETIGVTMVLVAPTSQRDPGPAIDEQSGGSGAEASGTVPATRQRRSR